MKKEIIIDEKKSEVTLLLSLSPRVVARDPRMTITTRMAKTMLENENFKLDNCLKSDIIDNNSANSKHSGVWKFSLIAEKVVVEEPAPIKETVAVKKKKTTTKKKSSSKKKA
tara:strand:+ start:354 stop:689 length:336 start_codon:yes stop_codon:yes gene_type:complete